MESAQISECSSVVHTVCAEPDMSGFVSYSVNNTSGASLEWLAKHEKPMTWAWVPRYNFADWIVNMDPFQMRHQIASM